MRAILGAVLLGAAVLALVWSGDEPSARTTGVRTAPDAPPPEADPLRALFERAQRGEPEDRRAAVEALGRSGAAAVPYLIGLLGDEDVVFEAIDALGKIGPAASEAIPPLVALMRDELETRYRAEQESDLQPPGSFRHVSTLASMALERIGDAAIPHLVPLLEHEYWAMRHTAGSTLSGIGEASIPELLRVCAEGSAPARAQAVEELGKLGEFEAVLHHADDPDADVRSAAAGALHAFGERAVPRLVEALGDDAAAANAADSLEKIGAAATPAVPRLDEALRHPDVEVRRNAAEALGAIGAPAAPAAKGLVRLLGEDDWIAAEHAVEALSKIGTGALPALRDALFSESKEVRGLAARAIGQLQDDNPDMEAVLLDMLASEDFAVRFGGARGLGYRGLHPDRGLPVLLEALGRKDGNDVIFAADAIGAYGAAATKALPDLLAAVGRLERREYWGIGSLEFLTPFRKAFLRVGRHDLPALAAALGHESAWARLYAAEAIVEIGAPARPHVERYLEGAPPEARQLLPASFFVDAAPTGTSDRESTLFTRFPALG